MQLEKKENRRNCILDAVIDSKVSANRYRDKSHTSIEYIPAPKIAEKAGVSTRTLNRYFPDYDVMIYEAASRFIDQYIGNMEKRYYRTRNSMENGLERVRLFVGLWVAECCNHTRNTLMYTEAYIQCMSIGLNKACRNPEMGKTARMILEEAIQEGIQDGSIRRELSTKDAAIMVSGTLVGLIQRLLFVYQTDTLKRDKKEVFKLLDEYIKMICIYLEAQTK